MGERGLSGIQYHKRTVASLTKQITEKEGKVAEVLIPLVLFCILLQLDIIFFFHLFLKISILYIF